MRVLKWNVPVDDLAHTIGGGKVLMVAEQTPTRGAVVQVWTLEPDRPSERKVIVVGTGHDVPDGYEWIGSTLTSGPLVWHLFEEARP